MKSSVSLEGPSPQATQETHMLFGAVGYLLHLHSILCFIEPHSYHQGLLSEVTSNVVFIHGSHSYLAFVILPGMKSEEPHASGTFRLQNHTLNRCCAVWSLVAWTGSACPLAPVFIFPYLSAILEYCNSRFCDTPPPPPMWTPAATFICQHTQEWQQLYLTGAGPREVILPKLRWNKIHTIHTMLLISSVLWAALGFSLLSA